MIPCPSIKEYMSDRFLEAGGEETDESVIHVLRSIAYRVSVQELAIDDFPIVLQPFDI